MPLIRDDSVLYGTELSRGPPSVRGPGLQPMLPIRITRPFLHVLEGTMNAERYIKVLEQHMLPSR